VRFFPVIVIPFSLYVPGFRIIVSPLLALLIAAWITLPVPGLIVNTDAETGITQDTIPMTSTNPIRIFFNTMTSPSNARVRNLR
jgi:hypothetical protein